MIQVANIFVSYKEGDSIWRNNFISLMGNPNEGFNHETFTSDHDYRTYGYEEVRKYLNGLIGSCRLLVCLIGTNTYQSQWVFHELSVASSLKIGIAPICITNTRFIIPDLIASKNIPIFDWDITDIRRALTWAFEYTARH